MIDFADARVAPREYEWPALWFSALDCDLSSLGAFMAAYDPTERLNADFRRLAMAYTLLHEFGPEIIAEVLSARQAAALDSMRDLQSALWGEAES